MEAANRHIDEPKSSQALSGHNAVYAFLKQSGNHPMVCNRIAGQELEKFYAGKKCAISCITPRGRMYNV